MWLLFVIILLLLTAVFLVNVMKPGVGQDQEGFASVIGEFDSLLDTAFDERGGRKFIPEETTLLYGGSVLDLLKSRHSCDRYVKKEGKKELKRNESIIQSI
jgi:hypothetical protein